MTGSKEAVSQAEHIITEISEDVVTERVEIPEPFTSYITVGKLINLNYFVIKPFTSSR